MFVRFDFLLAYITSVIFYLLHDDVTSSSAINLQLHLIQDLPITDVCTALCVAANNEDNDPGRDSNKTASAARTTV